MNPRTVCFCQPVASMISASVDPCSRPISARTMSFLLAGFASTFVAIGATFFVLAAGFAALAFRAGRVAFFGWLATVTASCAGAAVAGLFEAFFLVAAAVFFMVVSLGPDPAGHNTSIDQVRSD